LIPFNSKTWSIQRPEYVLDIRGIAILFPDDTGVLFQTPPPFNKNSVAIFIFIFTFYKLQMNKKIFNTRHQIFYLSGTSVCDYHTIPHRIQQSQETNTC